MNLVLRLAEDYAQHTRPLAQLLQRVPIMRFKVVAEPSGHGRRLLERRLRLLIGHFQKKQKRQLLDVIAVRQTVIAEDVAVVPEFGDQLMGAHIRIASLHDA